MDTLISSFTWLDYSAREKRKMLDVIDLFREHDTRDEIGISVIRDGISDVLFPGTGTVQTRARYFLFIPWIYRRLEEQRTPGQDFARRARQAELDLARILMKTDLDQGIIGSQAKDALERLPSNIYWRGLGIWGIRRFSGTQEMYHRDIDRFYLLISRQQRNDDNEPVAGRVEENWHPGLPAPPPSFPTGTTLQLRREEAVYLQERIEMSVPNTLLAFFAKHGRFTTDVAFPWQHPQCAELPPCLQTRLQHAQNFSETIHGAALLYNLLLAQKAQREERIAEYTQKLAEWATLIETRAATLAKWDRGLEFWTVVESSGAHPTVGARRFTDSWLELALSNGGARSITRNPAAAQLIRDRERVLKRGQARLENPDALRLWTGAAGTGRLNYRWHRVQTILNDILNGVAENINDA
jgi:hypothetical protein